MKFALLITISLLLAWPSTAQDRYSTGSCEPPQGTTFLEVGNVKASIQNDGGLFSGSRSNRYEVPASGGVDAMSSMSFLVSGLIDGEPRAAASWWTGREFWPGPIPEDGSSPVDCAAFDRFWTLDHDRDFWPSDAAPIPSQAVQDWPTDLGAPFVDRNGQPGYQPDEGDHPEMHGDREVWWIMNDRGNTHPSSKSDPLGIEVHASAFGFDTANELGNVTFYRYTVFNRGSKTIEDMAVGFFQDMDLGNIDDDRAGTDTTLAMLYTYNDSNLDLYPPSGYGYGERPPAVGTTVLEARHVRGILPSDLGLSPSFHLTMTGAPHTGGGVTGDPTSASDYHNFMTGKWKDGVPFTEGGPGRGFSEHPMPFWMPGDPLSGAFWSELNVDMQGGQRQLFDRIANMAFGAFDLQPGEWAQFTFAVLWARGQDNMDSLVQLRALAEDLHTDKAELLAPRSLKTALFRDGNPNEGPQHPFWVDEPYPNPANDELTLRASFDKSGPVSVRISDLLGRTRLEHTVHADIAGLREIKLDTSGLTPGSYTVTVESWSHRTTHTFVVLR